MWLGRSCRYSRRSLWNWRTLAAYQEHPPQSLECVCPQYETSGSQLICLFCWNTETIVSTCFKGKTNTYSKHYLATCHRNILKESTPHISIACWDRDTPVEIKQLARNARAGQIWSCVPPDITPELLTRKRQSCLQWPPGRFLQLQRPVSRLCFHTDGDKQIMTLSGDWKESRTMDSFSHRTRTRRSLKRTWMTLKDLTKRRPLFLIFLGFCCLQQQK